MSQSIFSCSGYIANNPEEWLTALGIPQFSELQRLLAEVDEVGTGYLSKIVAGGDEIFSDEVAIAAKYREIQEMFMERTGMTIHVGYHPD